MVRNEDLDASIQLDSIITDLTCGKFSGPTTLFSAGNIDRSRVIRGFSGPFLMRKQKRKLEEIRITFRHVHSKRV